ncbi:uncharacterized protein LOC121052759 [Rosa chinensis]|uniref:uncharacterized protein LOC121052759 n=1 Tax=Rosa chinensis TaxID=74649 RepID=UPI001AD8E416|nr:uncharacterized protein LOC121052759 [Rosa chinensis]
MPNHEVTPHSDNVAVQSSHAPTTRILLLDITTITSFLFPFCSAPNLLLHLRTAPNRPLLPYPPPIRTRPFSASDQHPAKNEEREAECEGLGLKDGGCSRVQGPHFGDESEQLRKKCATVSERNKCDERQFDSNKRPPHRAGLKAAVALPVASEQSQFASKQNNKAYPRRRPRCTPGNTGPQSRDTPPKRDTGIASEKEWGISLLNEHVKESNTKEDGSTWYRESGEKLGNTEYRFRWTRMGGASHDSSSEWSQP